MSGILPTMRNIIVPDSVIRMRQNFLIHKLISVGPQRQIYACFFFPLFKNDDYQRRGLSLTILVNDNQMKCREERYTPSVTFKSTDYEH